MADQENRPTVQDSGVNWTGVAVGGLLLALVVAVIEPLAFRVVAAVAALVLTIYISHTREEREIENPLLEQVRQKSQGLDRRKYGRLRNQTERFLENVRQMNRIAVDARSGKVSQRHAHGEIDRLASKMRELVDEIRKAAGIPTPTGESRRRQRRVVEPGGGRPGTSPETGS